MNPSPPPETAKISPDDLERMIAASTPEVVPGPSRGKLRRQLLLGIAIGAVGVGASIMSCVGQSFSYRQARAMEGIEQQLKEMRASCSAPVPREIAR